MNTAAFRYRKSEGESAVNGSESPSAHRRSPAAVQIASNHAWKLAMLEVSN
jgi:hypothetical protein